MRITGGIFGARQTINTEIATPNSITNRAVDKLDDIFKNPTIKPQGEFVTPEGLRFHITEVYVPANTKLTVGKVALQKNWGKGGGIQYELKNNIPDEAFRNTRPLRGKK